MISMMVYSQKGGVGKTHTSIWLAYLLATGGIDGLGKKHRVVLVDLDSQQNASNMLLEMMKRPGMPYALPPLHPSFKEGNPENGEWNGYSTSSDILFDRQFMYYDVPGIENLRVLPSEGRVDRLNNVLKEDGFIPLISELTQLYLDVEEEFDETDIIIFDSPPSKTSICEGFLSRCSHVMIPTQLECDSVDGVATLLDNIKIYNESRDEPIKVTGVIPNLVRSINLTNSELEQYEVLTKHTRKYEKSMGLNYDLIPDDFFLVNRTIFKPRRKPDNLREFFNLKKDPKAQNEMDLFYSFMCNRLDLE